MLVRDKTHKVKVWDHNDAVIYVYEKVYFSKVDPKDPEKRISKQETNVITAIPVNADYNTDRDEFIQRVANTVASLEVLYSTEPDSEVGICYVINTPYVNC